jgi:metallo-beta-lactamase class B
MFGSLAIAGALAAAGPAAGPATVADWRRACAGKDGWSDPAPPLHVFANVYDVGTCGITALLITSPKGHVLLDAATAEAAPAIAANIQRLGFRLADIKLIGGSHEHVDHAGGIAELQRLTGATVMASAGAYNPYETGKLDPDDPQAGLLPPYPPSKVGILLADEFVVRQGPLRLTAHLTPGHSPGSTTWSWRSCEGKTCLNIVYADSLTAVSRDDYRFSDHRRYVAAFRASIEDIARLKCDLLITPHPGASNFIDRLDGKAPLVDPSACKAYAAKAKAALDQRLAKEKAGR